MQKHLDSYDSSTQNQTIRLNQNGQKEVTYIFDMQEEVKLKELAPKFRRNGLWQIFPSACASLTCIPFGLMLGWPSPTYPTLLASDTPVPITLDQSAMIAGFLMFGVSFGTIFCSKSIGVGPKYGIILGNVFILLGWIIMWKAMDIYGLLGSRLLLGCGHGYAMGQIKIYIQEMTENSQAVGLIKHLFFYGTFGFVLAYAIGPFVEFRQYSLISLMISAFILFLMIFLPSTPRELIRAKKMQDAKKLLVFLRPDLNADQETHKIVQNLADPPDYNGFMKIMRDQTLRISFIKLTILLVCQQYCGAPPTLVYTQIIFTKSHIPLPEYVALLYAVLFFISGFVGTYISPKYNKKAVLLISSCSVLILYICKILVIYFRVNEHYFRYSSVIVMYLFIIAHTVGLGSIPFTLINDWFPKSYRLFVTNYFIILFSILALTITKIFQVLMGQFPLYIPFCLFTGVILFAIMFISICVPSKQPTTGSDDIYKLNAVKSVEMQEKK